jgi:short-chain Z-isoprenyl diphosphate synthase
MFLRDTIYALYGRRLRAQIAKGPVPGHVGLVMDGNRRWAREMGFEDVRVGHRYGAEHLEDVLGWCADVGIRHVTIFLASIDNVHKRSGPEVDYLMRVIEEVVAERLSRPSRRWRIRLAGRLDVLPDSTAHALKLAEGATHDRKTGFHVTFAVGYDGRVELADAVRSLLDHKARAGVGIQELAETLTADDIAAHLYTADRPDLDLVIRTSGERRLSGFLLWQAAHSEFQFCDVYWPGFRRIDFLRALRSYAARKARRQEFSSSPIRVPG